ncbi:LacI family DNA-binding transcriptional regulator [Modicisalibacter radicis]|uniref:LacI family DNA-binding transcriptional regulator n=1 Tax=Halomonas sp. EAR18 TaxID=2518972 RepID=UPI00109C61FB|nr:LacI family DNA-binding transcriptional regulator [Halomonas sp. EAR18]
MISRKPLKRVTMNEVAREANVSPAVAARALGGYGYVSETKRTQVEAAAARLGYRPNMIAKSMVTGRTRTIGIIGADISNPFFAGAVKGIADESRRHGFDTLLTNSDENTEIERDALRVLLAKRVDGLVVSPADVNDCDHLREAVQQGTPLVMLDRIAAGIQADSVVIDNVEASRRAIAGLITGGHRRIAMVTELGTQSDRKLLNQLDKPESADVTTLNTSGARLLGYLVAHRQAGLSPDPALIRPTDAYASASARQCTLELMALESPPTSIFTGDSVMTLGAFAAIQHLGISLPDQLAFMGFDDMDWMGLVKPSLSALRQPVYAMGAAAIELLMARLASPERPSEHRVFEVESILRDSTRNAWCCHN